MKRKQFQATDKEPNGAPVEFLEHFEIVPRQQVAFYLPCCDAISVPAHIEAIEKGDVAKICLRSKPQGAADQGYSFRMSLKLEVTSVEPDCFQGRVKVGPLNPSWVGGPNLPHGTPIQVRREEVYGVQFAEDKKYESLPPQPSAYWDRCCAIHESVLKKTSPVQFVYREKRFILKDELPNSGWCFTTEGHPIAEEDFQSGKVISLPLAMGGHYIFDGLSYDFEAWVAMMSEPLGAGFERDLKTGLFTPPAGNQ
jgi:hypothetical protein